MPWMHGRSVTGALCVAGWQVTQVLLTLPYSFSQLGMVSGVLLQIFYGLMGSWTAYLISVLYVEYRTRKEREKVDFRNHVIQVLPAITIDHYSYSFNLIQTTNYWILIVIWSMLLLQM